MKNTAWFAVVGLGFLGLAWAAEATIKLTVNGVVASPAIVVSGKTYVPLEALQKSGVVVTRSPGALALLVPGAAAGGANERASLEGCLNQTLFNGVWRVRASKPERISKDGNTPGWGLMLEVRNGSKATIMPVDAGVSGTGQGIQLAFGDATTLSVDPYDVQKLTFASLPPGGAVVHQLKFYYPLGTSEDQVKPPSKLLFEVNPKGIGDSTRANGVAFGVPNPSFRVRLDCNK